MAEPPPSLFDHLRTAIVVVDAAQRVRYLNSAAEALLEASAARVVGEPVSGVFEDMDEPASTICQARSSGQTLTKRQAQLHLASGTVLPADYSVTPFDDGVIIELEEIDHLLRINRDANAQAARETTRQLVRGLAHEIKNPLGGIRGAAQLLQRELSGEGYSDYTDVIISETDRLRSLVDRLLAPSTLVDRRPLNLYRVLERVLQLTEAETEGRVALERDYDPSLPELTGNADQLIQAFLNIARNACEALDGHPQARIQLRTRVIRNFNIANRPHRLVVRVEIIDNGPGIPPELISHLFFPMVSGRASGSGLGLSIAQAIVSQHGGAIECDSRPGETCFTVFLPLDSQK